MATKTDARATVLSPDLPAEIFDVQTNVPLIHQVVVAQLAAARQGTHSTKTRGEVRGGGKKPYKQKGTGRARQGSTRAPQFAGGGIVHGPQPRDYAQRTPKKMKALALRGALSDRARHGRIHVVESLVTGEAPSTKGAVELLAGLTDRKNMLIVLDRTDIVSLKSVRNLADVHVLAVDQLNTYDVLCADDVVFTKAAYDTFVAGSPVMVAGTDAEESDGTAAAAPKAAKATKAAKVVEVEESTESAEAADTTEAKELPAGAILANADGSSPDPAYVVKGNADSGLYHEPEGRWYDATVAEFWFKDAKAAKAAGFTKAGSKKKADEK